MKGALALGVAALLSACATTGAGTAPTPQWLVGSWLMMDPGERNLVACASFAPIGYEADGDYVLFDERGTWRLDGDRLTETATEVDDPQAPGASAIGQPQTSRIARTGRDSFVKTFASGGRAIFRRCPPPE
ncbi:MAG TPA: hypothetical protein VF552_07000 [Allosphingosinicella sp.]|jgi:hypothetical protein